MICLYCNKEIDEVTQHLGPNILVHLATGYHHCNADWEVRGSTVATPKEVTAK